MILLIDAYNLIIRNYVKNPHLNEDGENIGAVASTITSLYFLIKKFSPKQIYLCFEGKNSGSRRRRSFHDYKDGRKAPHTIKNYSQSNLNSNFWWCINKVVELIEFLPICILSKDNLEADDIISFICKNFKNKEITIVSTDKDYYQLINKNISVYSPIKNVLYNYENFLETFKILPVNWLIFKAISGDSSDNIAKIPLRIGIKTLLKKFPELSKNKFDITSFIELTKTKDNKIFDNYIDLLTSNYDLMNLIENKQLSWINEKALKLQIADFEPKFDSINFDMMSHKYGIGYNFSQNEFSFLFKRLRNEFTSEKSNIREIWQ